MKVTTRKSSRNCTSRRFYATAMALAMMLVGCGGPGTQTAEPSSKTDGQAVESGPTSPSTAGGSGSERKFDEAAIAEFYRGKTVRIVLGLAAGSGADLTARLVAKHIPQYIPGNPTVIVENMTGAGGLLAANTVFNTAPKDGTVIGTPLEGFPLQQVLGADGVQFDAARFQWIGSLVKSPTACLARTDSGVDTIEDIISGGKQLTVASSGPGGSTHNTPAVLAAALKANFQIVPGYAGGGESRLAVENGEVDGYCVSLSSMLSTLGSLLEGENPKAKIIVVMGPETPDHPLLQGVPAAETLAPTEEAKKMLNVVDAASQMTRPFAFPPGVPEDRVAAIRTAFDKTVQDPAFLAAAREADVEIDANTGEEVAVIVNNILNTPPELVNQLKDALK